MTIHRIRRQLDAAIIRYFNFLMLILGVMTLFCSVSNAQDFCADAFPKDARALTFGASAKLRQTPDLDVYYHSESQRYGQELFCKMPCDFTDLATKLYGTGGVDLLKKFEAINPAWSVLISDPGVTQRLNDFTRFVYDNDLYADNPWHARGRFAESLGTKTVYRALALTPEAYEAILTNGIEAPAVAVGKKDSRPGAINVVKQIQSRLEDHSVPDYVQSVTAYPGVATAVAASVGKGKPIYLFEMAVPKIDLLFIDRQGKIIGQEAPTWWAQVMGKRAIKIGDSINSPIYKLTPEVESMVVFKIPLSEILSVTMQDPKGAPRFDFVVDEKH